jgi:hypothetical protein
MLILALRSRRKVLPHFTFISSFVTLLSKFPLGLLSDHGDSYRHRCESYDYGLGRACPGSSRVARQWLQRVQVGVREHRASRCAGCTRVPDDHCTSWSDLRCTQRCMGHQSLGVRDCGLGSCGQMPACARGGESELEDSSYDHLVLNLMSFLERILDSRI